MILKECLIWEECFIRLTLPCSLVSCNRFLEKYSNCEFKIVLVILLLKNLERSQKDSDFSNVVVLTKTFN